jgi:hypothetical protein
MGLNSTDFVHIGETHWGRHVYAVSFKPGCLSNLPWGDDTFECAILPCKDDAVLEILEDIAQEVVNANTEWVHATGIHAEQLHDLIDRTSVKIARQEKVGDGSPMTAWFTESTTIQQKAKIVFNNFGGSEYAIAVIIGDDQEFKEAVMAINNELLQINREHQETEKAA